MLNRLIHQLGLWMSVCLTAAATAGLVMANEPAQGDKGKVEAIEITHTAPEHKPINPETVIGGVVGGVIGHQIGGGRGKTAATVAGTIGGAVVGNQTAKKQGLEEA